MRNQFTKKSDTFTYCEQNCPKPYNEQPAAVWVADQMNKRWERGQMRDYNLIQSWALKNHIDYDVAYCWEFHRR